MGKEDLTLKERILKEFSNENVNKRALDNIDHPIYSVLSERLQLPKKTIRQVILENVPRINIERNR